MLTLTRIRPTDDDWRRMDASADQVIFQTREWMQFVARTQDAEPVVASVRRGDEPVGYFTGLLVRRWGVRILGSPFPGWTTATMGFVLDDGVDRIQAATALIDFAFGDMRCMHLELSDRLLGPGDVAGLGYRCRDDATFEVDLDADDATILGAMSSAARRAVRKSEKVGLTVEVAGGPGFADEYHEQLQGVFARQSLVPTYGVERVRALIDCLEPTGRLLLLRAVTPDARSVATAIFPAHHGTAYFWGGASVRDGQILRPNEALFWFAMRYWRDRGVTTLDMGGANDYKRRYGGRELTVPSLRRSRSAVLEPMRGVAQAAVRRRQQWQGRRHADSVVE